MHVRSFGLVLALLLAVGALLFADVASAGWHKEYAKMDPATRAWAVQATSPLLLNQHAHSPAGGNCCAWADGYQLGETYHYHSHSRGGEELPIVMFWKWWLDETDHTYHAIVWNMSKERYEEITALPEAFSPGNPTGRPIVWLRWENGTVSIRCWGGEAQG